ncbi:MAG: methylated-DNA--[protein]-cysteine S-methyltransferase, partial [Planctomycetes bacterium]|nr:methylated-DNA--[protein]-cysteine S-methyltransferase [Planctomycetota bacterium]
MGRLLLAATRRGVCAVFLGDGDRELLDFLKAEFPRRAFTQDADGLRTWASAVAHLVEGKTPRCKVPTDVDATPFQQRVWQQLCKIPRGHTRSYREIAQALGQPDAARAVARACA